MARMLSWGATAALLAVGWLLWSEWGLTVALALEGTSLCL